MSHSATTEITFSNDETHRVRAVPPAAIRVVFRAYADDPEMQRAMANDFPLLYAFDELSVPEGWQLPEAFSYAGVQPRDGKSGRKLDYIEYVLLATESDNTQIQRAMFGDVTEEDIQAAAETFPAGVSLSGDVAAATADSSGRGDASDTLYADMGAGKRGSESRTVDG